MIHLNHSREEVERWWLSRGDLPNSRLYFTEYQNTFTKEIIYGS